MLLLRVLLLKDNTVRHVKEALQAWQHRSFADLWLDGWGHRGKLVYMVPDCGFPTWAYSGLVHGVES